MSAADRYYTYGFVPFIVEPDFECECPRIIIDNPMGVHYTLNLKGDVTHYVKVWREEAATLAAKFPEHASVLLTGEDQRTGGDKAQLEVVRYIDRDVQVLYLPERNNLVLT